jgi:hypothetical protein
MVIMGTGPGLTSIPATESILSAPAQVGRAEDAADDGDSQGASGFPGGVVDGLVMSAGTDADTAARPGNDSAREHTYRNSAAGH